MELTVKPQTLENCQLRVDVEIPQGELQSEYEVVKKEFRQYAQIPGFRKGKVPLDILDKKYKDAIKGKVVEKILPKAFMQAVAEHNLSTFGQARAENISKYEDNKPLTVEFTVDRTPSVELEKIDGIEIIEDEITIDDRDVQREIENSIRHKSTLEDVTTPASEGTS